MKKQYKHICDRFCYRFNERISEGLLQSPNLQIIRLTIHGFETETDDIEFSPTELKVFIPIFVQFYHLRDKPQTERIEAMKEFIKQMVVEDLRNLPDSVLDCHKIIKRLETENFGQSDLIEKLESENTELKKLLDECFENGIAALGAMETIKPNADSEDLAIRVFKALTVKVLAGK